MISFQIKSENYTSECRIRILKKSYKTHLVRIHPGANQQNLCGLGQKMVADYFTTSTEKSNEDQRNTSVINYPSKQEVEPGGIGDDVQSSEENNGLDSDNDFDLQPLSKRIHESGDSAYGDDIEFLPAAASKKSENCFTGEKSGLL